MTKKTKKPILIITNDCWAPDPCVIFDDEQPVDIIPADWVDERYIELDGEIPRDQILNDMMDELFDENDRVDEFWPEKNILRTGDEFYEYDDSGVARYIRDNQCQSDQR